MYTMHTNYFYGNKVSEYGIEHKRVDYGTLAKAFDCVLNNEIMQKTYEIGYWEQESGFVDNSEEIEALQEEINELEEELSELEEIERLTAKQEIEMATIKDKVAELEEEIRQLEYEMEDYPDCYQFYIVSDGGARILKEITEN